MNETTDATAIDAPAPEPAAPSVADTLSRTYDEAEARGTEPLNVPQNELQSRGPDGRFVSSAPEPPPAKEPEAPSETAAPVAPAPSAGLPDFLKPYEMEFAQRGLMPDKAIPGLLDTWRQLEARPEDTLRWLANRYGLQADFRKAGEAAPPQQTSDEWVDPNVSRLEQELQSMRAEFQAMQNRQRQAQEAAYAQAMSAVTEEVSKFEASKAGDGFDFKLLRPLMQNFIASGEAADLEAAYDLAVWAHPTTRAARKEAERKQWEAETAKQNAAAQASARRAASINVRSDVATPAKPRTIAETLGATYDRVNSA